MKKLQKKPLLLAYILFNGIGLLFFTLTERLYDKGIIYSNTAANMILIALCFYLIMIVIGCFITYRMWQSIEDEHSRARPRDAVFFMFVPGYNIYWIFEVIYGFAQDYNNYIKRNSIETQGINENIFLGFTVISILKSVFPILIFILSRYKPWLGVFTAIITIIGIIVDFIHFFWGIKIIPIICDSVNSLSELGFYSNYGKRRKEVMRA